MVYYRETLEDLERLEREDRGEGKAHLEWIAHHFSLVRSDANEPYRVAGRRPDGRA